MVVLEIVVDLESEDWEALRVLASSLLDARLADIVITATDTPGYNEERYTGGDGGEMQKK